MGFFTVNRWSDVIDDAIFEILSLIYVGDPIIKFIILTILRGWSEFTTNMWSDPVEEAKFKILGSS